MDALSAVRGLNGVTPVQTDEEWWLGAAKQPLAIENEEGVGDSVRFDVLLPTIDTDIEDYIWRGEREAGTTEKVVLVQLGSPVDGARIVAIQREGPGDDRWVPAETHRYRLTFEVPIDALQDRLPLALIFRTKTDDGWKPVAFAQGQ